MAYLENLTIGGGGGLTAAAATLAAASVTTETVTTANVTTANVTSLNVATVLAFTPTADPPDSAAEGMLYADTDHKLYYYNGTAWKEVQFVSE